MITPQALTFLCQLIYFDPPAALLCRIGNGLTAGALAKALLSGPPPCGPLTPYETTALEAVTHHEALRTLLVVDYINKNAGSGLVAYAFRAADGLVICGFRGSESTLSCAPTNIDWLDNVFAPFVGSTQYPRIERFAAKYRTGPVLFTGHSKGGHNALYALASCPHSGARCVCFDAQGFAPDQLTSGQKAHLHAHGINYVQRRDVVGALLCHPEKRVFVAGTGEGNHHALSAMAFDEEGYPIPRPRSAASLLINLTSCATVRFVKREMEKRA